MNVTVRKGGDWYNGRVLDAHETVVTCERHDPHHEVEHEVTEVAEPDMGLYIDTGDV